MKIVHLVAGAGGMYCGSCMHGNTLATALSAAGHDVLLVPLYTPLRTDEGNLSIDRVAYGGINVYLQQQSALFRRTPWLFDRLLDRPKLLRWLSSRSGSTQPQRLGAMTVSMLRGEEGRQRKELEKLLRWLQRDVRPEVVHLSNVMLAGTARELTARLDVPVVCTLSGEDVFLEKLPEPHYSEARAVLRERAGDLAALVAMNGYYADFMADYLDLPRERVRVIPPGLNLNGHGSHLRAEPIPPDPSRPMTIGYLSRICPEKGLHQLVEAFRQLVADDELPPLRLAVAGYLGADERPYLEEIRTQLTGWGLADRFEYAGELDRAGKIAFLQSVDVMSVPSVYPESKGLPILEAWANAVPVVLPDHGAFSELVRDTGGGLLCEPDDPQSLAAGLKQMILDRELAAVCGREAHQAVGQRYGAPLLAQRTIALYRTVRSRFEAVLCSTP